MDEPAHIVFSEKVVHKGATTPLSLSVNGVIRWADSGERSLSTEKDVLGFATEGSDVEIKALLETGAGLLCVAPTGPLVRKSFVFRFFCDDAQRLFCLKLRQFIDSLGRPKRLFVFVNPFGGKKSASKIYVDQVKPLLDDADVQVTLQETEHQLHAKELAKTMDLKKYDGIVCVSGDGILVEVVNGLLEREDWKTAIKTPLGVVPGGTGNGMAKSLTDFVGEPCTAANAVLAIIRGHTRSLDVTTVLQGNIKFFSVLMLAWGLVADIDIESEKYRWMGSARLDLYGLQRIMNLRLYNGSISFVPAPGFEEYGEPSSYKSESSSSDCVSNKDLTEKQKVSHGYQGPRVSLESMNWRKVSGPFASVWLHNVTWGSEDTMAAPNAQFSDGYIDLIYMKDVSKLALLSLMSKLNNGNHVKSPHVVYLKVKAFVLEPGQRVDRPAKGGIIDSDGEVLARGNGTYKCDQNTLMAYDKLEMIVDRGLATLFCPV